MQRAPQSSYREESQAAAKIRALRRHVQNQQRSGGGGAYARGGDPLVDHTQVLGIVHQGPGTAADGGPTFAPSVKIAGYGGTTGFGITPQSNYPAMVALFSEDGAPPVSTAEQPTIPFELCEAVQERLSLTKAAHEKSEGELAAKVIEHNKTKASLAASADEVAALRAKVKSQQEQLEDARKQNAMLVELASAHDMKVFKLQDLANELQTKYDEKVKELTAKNYKTSDAFVAMAHKDSIIAALKRENADMTRRIRQLEEEEVGEEDEVEDFGGRHRGVFSTTHGTAGKSGEAGGGSLPALASQALELHRNSSLGGLPPLSPQDLTNGSFTASATTPTPKANRLRAILKEMVGNNKKAVNKERLVELEAENKQLVEDMAELSRAYDDVRRKSEATARAHSEHSMELEDTLMRIYNANTVGRPTGIGSSYFFRSGMAAAAGIGIGTGGKRRSRANSGLVSIASSSSAVAAQKGVSANQFAASVGRTAGTSSSAAGPDSANNDNPSSQPISTHGVVLSPAVFSSTNPTRFSALSAALKELSEGLLLGVDTYAEFSSSSLPIVASTLQGVGGLAEVINSLSALLCTVEADTKSALSISELREAVNRGVDPSGAGLLEIQRKAREALTTVRNGLRGVTVEEMENRIAAAKQGLASSAAGGGGRAGRMTFVNADPTGAGERSILLDGATSGNLSRTGSLVRNLSRRSSVPGAGRRQSICVTDLENALMIRGGGASANRNTNTGSGLTSIEGNFISAQTSGTSTPRRRSLSTSLSNANTSPSVSNLPSPTAAGGGGGKAQKKKNATETNTGRGVAGVPNFSSDSYIAKFLDGKKFFSAAEGQENTRRDSSNKGAASRLGGPAPPSPSSKHQQSASGHNKSRPATQAAPVAELHSSLVLHRIMLRRALLYGAGLQTALEVSLKLLSRVLRSNEKRLQLIKNNDTEAEGEGDNRQESVISSIILADVMPASALPHVMPEALRTTALLHPFLKEAIDYGRERHYDAPHNLTAESNDHNEAEIFKTTTGLTQEAVDNDIVGALEAYFDVWMHLGVSIAPSSRAPPGKTKQGIRFEDHDDEVDVGIHPAETDNDEEESEARDGAREPQQQRLWRDNNGTRGRNQQQRNPKMYEINIPEFVIDGLLSADEDSSVVASRKGEKGSSACGLSSSSLSVEELKRIVIESAAALGIAMTTTSKRAEDLSSVARGRGHSAGASKSHNNAIFSGSATGKADDGDSRETRSPYASYYASTSPTKAKGGVSGGSTSNKVSSQLFSGPEGGKKLNASPLSVEDLAKGSINTANPVAINPHANMTSYSNSLMAGAGPRSPAGADGSAAKNKLLSSAVHGSRQQQLLSRDASKQTGSKGLPSKVGRPPAQYTTTSPTKTTWRGGGTLTNATTTVLGTFAPSSAPSATSSPTRVRSAGGSPFSSPSPSRVGIGSAEQRILRIKEDDQRTATERRQRSLQLFLDRQQRGRSLVVEPPADDEEDENGDAHEISETDDVVDGGRSRRRSAPRGSTSSAAPSHTVKLGVGIVIFGDAPPRAGSNGRATTGPTVSPLRKTEGKRGRGTSPIPSSPSSSEQAKDENKQSEKYFTARGLAFAAGAGNPDYFSHSPEVKPYASPPHPNRSPSLGRVDFAQPQQRRISLSLSLSPREEMFAAVTAAGNSRGAATSSPPRSRRSIDLQESNDMQKAIAGILEMAKKNSPSKRRTPRNGSSLVADNSTNGQAAAGSYSSSTPATVVETYANPTNPFAEPPIEAANNGLIDYNSPSALMVQSTYLIDTLPENRMAYVMGSGTGTSVADEKEREREKDRDARRRRVGTSAVGDTSLLDHHLSSLAGTLNSSSNLGGTGKQTGDGGVSSAAHFLPKISGAQQMQQSLRAQSLSGGRVAVLPPPGATVNAAVGGFLPYLAPRRGSPLRSAQHQSVGDGVAASNSGNNSDERALPDQSVHTSVSNLTIDAEFSRGNKSDAAVQSAAALQKQLLLKLQQLSGGETIPSRAAVNNLRRASPIHHHDAQQQQHPNQFHDSMATAAASQLVETRANDTAVDDARAPLVDLLPDPTGRRELMGTINTADDRSSSKASRSSAPRSPSPTTAVESNKVTATINLFNVSPTATLSTGVPTKRHSSPQRRAATQDKNPKTSTTTPRRSPLAHSLRVDHAPSLQLSIGMRSAIGEKASTALHSNQRDTKDADPTASTYPTKMSDKDALLSSLRSKPIDHTLQGVGVGASLSSISKANVSTSSSRASKSPLRPRAPPFPTATNVTERAEKVKKLTGVAKEEHDTTIVAGVVGSGGETPASFSSSSSPSGGYVVNGRRISAVRVGEVPKIFAKPSSVATLTDVNNNTDANTFSGNEANAAPLPKHIQVLVERNGGLTRAPTTKATPQPPRSTQKGGEREEGDEKDFWVQGSGGQINTKERAAADPAAVGSSSSAKRDAQQSSSDVPLPSALGVDAHMSSSPPPMNSSVPDSARADEATCSEASHQTSESPLGGAEVTAKPEVRLTPNLEPRTAAPTPTHAHDRKAAGTATKVPIASRTITTNTASSKLPRHVPIGGGGSNKNKFVPEKPSSAPTTGQQATDIVAVSRGKQHQQLHVTLPESQSVVSPRLMRGQEAVLNLIAKRNSSVKPPQ